MSLHGMGWHAKMSASQRARSWWNADRDDKLRELWAAGLTTTEIGQALGSGCTKNAVIGRAHRLELPPRPSPIRQKRAP